MPFDHLQADPQQPEVLGLGEFSPIARKLAAVDKVRDLYRRVQQSPQGFRLERLLAELRVTLHVRDADEGRIPSNGPVVVVANHPYGVLDGAILTVLLTRVRPDVKVLTNFLLADVPELRQHCIFVDPFQSDRSLDANRRALREAVAWLHRGGMLAVFPAGEVSHWRMPAAQIADPQWNDTAARLARKTGAAALPVFFCGNNSLGFQILGMIHPKLRTAFLLQEFLQQEGKTVEVRVGSAIPAAKLGAIADDRAAIEYLRSRTYLLAHRRRPEANSPWPRPAFRMRQAVASPVPADLLAEEVARLPEDRCLAENPEFSVWIARAQEIPGLMREIGRLREITFRAAGEGTGKSVDLDRFDDYYQHLFLWHKTKRALVGAYRVGNTAEILPARGIAGLYTSTLFRYDEKLFQKLGPALELGRSFVGPEYQRQYAPLLFLWKGIAALVARQPEVPVLFGAVSISNEYNAASREMVYRFFEERMRADELAGLIEPRRPFRPPLLRRWDCRGLCSVMHDLEELSGPISDLESDGKGLPILLRQYVKVGGKLIGFNVDRKFSNVLDGLVVVDLRRTEPAVLERYMGREAAARFQKAHAAAAEQ